MTSENSIHLVKDFIIPKTTQQGAYLTVTTANIPTLDSTSFGHGASIFSKEMLDFVQTQRETNWRMYFYVYKSNYRLSDNIYYVRFESNFCTQLDHVLRKYSIQVIAKVKYTGITEARTYCKSFDCSERGKDGYLIQPIFGNYNQTMESDVTVDIFIRWPEARMPRLGDGDTSTIKLSTDSFLQNLFEKESSKDLKIVAGNGAEVKCHRIVFEAHSDVLTAMLSPENGLSESKTGNVVLKENSEEGIRHFIRYLYGMELIANDFSSEVTIELFELAHKYQMKALEDHLCKFLLGKGSDWFRPDPLLELYFHVKNIDEFKNLQEHALTIIISMSNEIRSCEQLDELGHEDAPGLVWKLVELGKQNGGTNPPIFK